MAQLPPAPHDPPLDCLVVSGRRLYGDLLADWIAATAGDMLTVHAGDHAAAEHDWRARTPDVLLLEIDDPHRPGLTLAAARTFLERRPEGHLIVLAPAEFRMPRWLAEHSPTVVTPAACLDELGAALTSVLRRTRSTRPGLPGAATNLRRLSRRESEVLRLIGAGLDSASIATQLGISLNTVATHRKRIAAKLGTRGNQLTRYATTLRERARAPAHGGPDGGP